MKSFLQNAEPFFTFPSLFQVRIVTFPPEILRRNSLLTNLVIDDNTRSEFGVPDCDNVFVYMSDSTNPALIVYDSRKDSAWRITHPYMFPDPDFGTYRVKFINSLTSSSFLIFRLTR